MDNNYISMDFFKKRLIDLGLKSGLSDFPTKRREQLIILKSIAILFQSDHQYQETEVNVRIKSWLTDNPAFPQWDFIMLRRRLVDEGFLDRNNDGSFYWLNPDGPKELIFDQAIDGLNIPEVLIEGEKQIALKKAEFLRNQASREVTP